MGIKKRSGSFHSRLWTGVFAASVVSAALAQTSDLPTGFGGINIGDKWEDIQSRFGFQGLDEIATPWDGFVIECGRQSVLIKADKGDIVVTTNDFVVTEVGFVTSIKEGSDLLAVADLVMQTYGQPDRASMRNVLGRVTIDRTHVNHVTLDYGRPRPVQFTISGRELWQSRIHVRHERTRWHENKTMRCARAMEKEAAKQAERQADEHASTQQTESVTKKADSAVTQ